MADGIRQLSDPSLPWPSDEQILADLGRKDSEADLTILLGRMRLLEQDHGPDGWPAVQMRDITALCDAVMRGGSTAREAHRLRALLAQAEEALERIRVLAPDQEEVFVEGGLRYRRPAYSVVAERALAEVREGRR